MFSLIGECTYNALENKLIIVDNNKLKLLGFTYRPYRQQMKYDNPITVLNNLFNKNNNPDSFSKDPPNATLVLNNKQVVYKLINFDINTNTFHLNPLENHTEDYTGEFSLFIDTINLFKNNILLNLNYDNRLSRIY